MEFKERAGRSLAYIAIEPDGYDQRRAYPMVVLLHGFGSHMGDLAGLCPAIDRERYVYICPNAPISMEIGPGMTGYAWTRLEEPYAEDGDRAEEMLAELFDEVMEEYRTEAGAAMLGGFSQGGMMTYSAGLVAPERFRGLGAERQGPGPGQASGAIAGRSRPGHTHRSRHSRFRNRRGGGPPGPAVPRGGGLQARLQGVPHGARDQLPGAGRSGRVGPRAL